MKTFYKAAAFLASLSLAAMLDTTPAWACAGNGTAAGCVRAEGECMRSFGSWFKSCNYNCGDCPIRPPHWNPGPPNTAPIAAAPGAIRDTIVAAGNVIVRPFVQCYQWISGNGNTSGWSCVEAAGMVVVVAGGIACSALVPGCAGVLLVVGGGIAAGTTGNCMYQCLATNDEASCQRACGQAIVANASFIAGAYPRLPPGSSLRPGNWIRPYVPPAPPAPVPPPTTPVTTSPNRPPTLPEPPAGGPWGSTNPTTGAHNRPTWRPGEIDPIVRPPGGGPVQCPTCPTTMPPGTPARHPGIDIAHNGMTFAQRMAYWWYWVRNGVLPTPTRAQILDMAHQNIGPSCVPCNRGHLFDPPWQFPPPPPHLIPGGPPMPPGGWVVPPGVQVPPAPGAFAPVAPPPVVPPPAGVPPPVILPPIGPGEAVQPD